VWQVVATICSGNAAEGELEVFTIAIVWVGHGGPPLVFRKIVGHADNLAAVGLVVRFAADVVVVLLVHDHDVVEVGKVMACVELACDVVNAIAASCTMLPHALVGQLLFE